MSHRCGLWKQGKLPSYVKVKFSVAQCSNILEAAILENWTLISIQHFTGSIGVENRTWCRGYSVFNADQIILFLPNRWFPTKLWMRVRVLHFFHKISFYHFLTRFKGTMKWDFTLKLNVSMFVFSGCRVSHLGTQVSHCFSIFDLAFHQVQTHSLAR